MDSLKAELFLGYLETQFQKLLKISELSVLERKVLENKESLFTLKDQFSTELFQGLWPRVETSLMDLESEENLSMEKNSQMKISIWNIQNQIFYLWLMLDQTQMDLNSLLHLQRPLG